MPLTIRDTLLWYKRPDVRALMVQGAANKEIGVRYDESFGKRPDALLYEQEVLQAVQRGATSFHASEELWQDPLMIETGMTRQRVDELRTGWDLVLDIDFTHFGATKLITKALCDALELHGITRYGLKFSGNKGFHIGVAWESFPKEWNGQQMAKLFPDAPRAMADYLVTHIDNADTGFALSSQLRLLLGEEESAKHAKRVCAQCGVDRKDIKRTQYFECTTPGCGKKGDASTLDPETPVCPTCGKIVFIHRFAEEQKQDARCAVCGATETRDVFDLKIDTQLIASRHLYRLEYSLHEKSGLVSLPIPSPRLMDFFRDEATTHKIHALEPFWYRDAPDQGYALLVKAMARASSQEDETVAPREIVWEADAATDEAFPPTILKMLGGMADGKKRGMFIIANFLSSVGWNYDMIEERLLKWNKLNPEPLREGDIHNHLRYHKQKNQRVLPPNFANPIYKDLGVYVEDELTRRCKNPVQYVRLRLKQAGPAPKKDVEKKE